MERRGWRCLPSAAAAAAAARADEVGAKGRTSHRIARTSVSAVAAAYLCSDKSAREEACVLRVSLGWRSRGRWAGEKRSDRRGAGRFGGMARKNAGVALHVKGVLDGGRSLSHCRLHGAPF